MKNPSLTVENYLKAIQLIAIRSREKWVGTGILAEEMGVSPGSVTSMLKTLAEAEPQLAHYKPYEGVSLTDAGQKHALKMLRRHRLIELFLAQTLNLSWDQVHEEAENMEHAVSDFLIDRIDDYLDHPEFDPHGDPIPAADGTMRGDATDFRSLSSSAEGSTVKIVRVINQNAEFLRYLSDAGLKLGATVRIALNNAQADIVQVTWDEHSLTIGHNAAEQIMVQ